MVRVSKSSCLVASFCLAAQLFFAPAGAEATAELGRGIVPEHQVHKALQELEDTIKSKKGSVITPDHEYQDWIGTHFVFELMNITNVELAKDAEKLETAMLAAAEVGGLTVLKSAGHQFDGKGEGATAFVVLAESHIAVHTWPELKYVAFDIFTCGKEEKAKTAAAFLSEAFGADVFVGARLPRGIPEAHALNQAVLNPSAAVEDLEKSALEGSNVNESVAEAWAYSMSDDDMEKIFSNSLHEFDVLEIVQSKWQQLEFIKNKKTDDVCLVLDNTVQICKSYNAAYSEVYVHLPIAYLHSVKKVLIVGGGDALALREVLKYGSVERVVQLELDEKVPELCEKHFGVNAHLPGKKDSDPRVEWKFGDAAKTIVDLVEAGERFDLLLLDISETDPSGTVSTEDFFRHVSKALSPTGIFIKNENYQAATASLFNEFLEVIYPVPMITQQTFVLGSNGTSLLLPHFTLLEENGVETSFLARGPSTRFRQLRSMIRRYSKRGLNYEAMASDAFQSRHSSSPWEIQQNSAIDEQSTIEGGECSEPSFSPCITESQQEPFSIPVLNWRSKPCEVPPQTDEIQIQISNDSPLAFNIAWVNPDTDEHVVVIPQLEPGTFKRLNTFFGHKFIIGDIEQGGAPIAELKIVYQLVSHPYISFPGLHSGIVASRLPMQDAKVLHRATNAPFAL